MLSDNESSTLDNISIATKRTWKLCILSFGMIPIDWTAFKKTLPDRGHGNLRMTNDIVEVLRNIATRNPDLYLDQMQDRLYEETQKHFSLSTIYKTLDKILGMSLHRLGTMSDELDIAARLAYVNLLHEITDDPSMFLFVDETAKDLKSQRRRRVWTYRGQNPRTHRADYFLWQTIRYTFIGAMDINGFVHEASSLIYRKTGADDNNDAAGTINQERFEAYVEYVLIPTLGRYDLKQPRSIVVMDNATTHIGDRTRQLIESVGAKLVFTAAGSPDLNPIEDCFHVYKADLQRHRNDPDIRNVEQAHLHALQAVTPQKARNEYRHLRGAIRNVPKEDDAVENEEEEIAVSIVAVGVAINTVFNYLN